MSPILQAPSQALRRAGREIRLALNDLPLAWRLARRELRGGLSGFRVFLACLALGVAAIAAVGSVNESVVAGLRADARNLLGGDLEIQLAARPLTDDQRAWIAGRSAALSEVVTMRAMVRPLDRPGQRSLVELKAVDGAYPLVGRIGLDPPMPLSTALAARDGVAGAVVDPALLDRLGASVGERLRLGEATVEVRAALVHEPDRVTSAFNLGPRFLVGDATLAASELVQHGSLTRHRTRVVLPDDADIERWTAGLKAAFPEAGWRVRDTREPAPGVTRFVDRMALFLTFVGLSALLVGGVGVANAIRAYVDGRVATIATFKCLGAPGRLVFSVYLLEVMVLAGLGVALGLVLGAILPLAGLAVAGDLLPVRIEPGIYAQPLLLAAAFGLLTALTFALWPLMRARTVHAGALFRQFVLPAAARLGPAGFLVLCAAAGCLALLTILSSSDRWFAFVFVVGALAILAGLRLAAAGVRAVAARLPRPRRSDVRLAIASLHRPGSATATAVVSLGLGIAVLVAVTLIEGAVRAQISDELPDSAPAFFFIDIQDSQVATFDTVVDGITGVDEVRRQPSLRGRITAIDGVPADDAAIDPDVRWAVRGERGVTTAPAPPDGTALAAGAWWPTDYRGEPLVSLDAGIARGFGVGVGDTITVNILGREITARIASLRRIDWEAIPFDFTLILDPASLAGAPITHLAAVFADPEAEAEIDRAVAAALPNVTAIRVRAAVETLNDIVAAIGDGIRAAGVITVLAGILVLAGAMAADERRRSYDAVVCKVLGATRGQLARVFAVEYGLLGLVTGMVATAIGTAVAWAVVTLRMGADWSFAGEAAAVTVVAAVLLTLGIGFAGTWRALGRKAAPYLRNE